MSGLYFLRYNSQKLHKNSIKTGGQNDFLIKSDRFCFYIFLLFKSYVKEDFDYCRIGRVDNSLF